MRVLISIVLFLSFLTSKAQFTVSGVVTNEQGEKLSFATVFIENTSIAASTNEKGDYVLNNISSGIHSLKVTFIGYQPFIQTIQINSNLHLDIQLKGEIYNMDQVEIQATRVVNKDHSPIKL